MIVNKKVYPPTMTYCAKVIPLAFDESMSYYETICNITNHINNEIIPKVNETMETVFTLSNKFIELKEYVDDNMLTKDVDDLTYYTKTTDLSNVALTGNYNDLSNKPTIPDVSNFITKDVNDLTYYTLTSNLSTVATSGNYNDLSNKPTIPDVSNFITKDVNNLTYYTLTSSLSTVATSGNYNDLSNKPTTTYYDTTSLDAMLSNSWEHNGDNYAFITNDGVKILQLAIRRGTSDSVGTLVTALRPTQTTVGALMVTAVNVSTGTSGYVAINNDGTITLSNNLNTTGSTICFNAIYK